MNVNIRIYKNVAGSLSINLSDVKNPTIVRNWTIPNEKNYVIVPVSFAASLFTTEAEKMIEGNFIFVEEQDLEALKKFVNDSGFYYSLDTMQTLKENAKYSTTAISKAIENNDTEKIAALFDNAPDSVKASIKAIAMEKLDSLSVSMIKLIEARTNFSLEDEE